MALRKLLWAGSLLLLAAVGGILHAAEGDIFTLLDDSNLRQGPDSSYASVSVAQEGEQAVELKSKGQWVKVRISASGDVGWLYSDSLERAASGGVVAPAPASDVIVETPALNMPPVNAEPANALNQSSVAPDVTVSDDLNGDVVVADVATEQKTRSEVTANMFVDGAVSSELTPVSNQVPTQDDVTDSGLVSNSPVSQPVVVQEEPVLNSQKTGHSESVAGEKTVAKSKVQNVIEAGALDDNLAVSGELAPVVSHQDKTDTLSEPLIAAIEPPVVSEPGDSAAIQAMPAQAKEKNLVVNSKAQRIEVEDVLNRDDIVAAAPTGSEPVKAVEAPAFEAAVATESAVTESTSLQTITAESAVPEPVKPEPVAATESAVVEPELKRPSAVTVNDNVSREITVADKLPALPTVRSIPASGVRQIVKTTTIRTGPGSSFDVLGWAGSGARVEAIEQQGGWLKVRLQSGGRTGWLETAVLTPAGTAQVPATMPVKADAQMQAVPEVEKYQRKEAKQPAELPVQEPGMVHVEQTRAKASPVAGPTDSNVVHFVKTANLRAGPDRKFDVVAWAGNGAYAMEMARQGDWVRVKMQESGRIGWAHINMLKRTNVAGKLPFATVMSDQVTEAPVPTAEASPKMIRPENEPAMVMSDPLKQQANEPEAPVSVAQPEVLAVKPMQSVNPVSSPELASGTTERSLFSFNRKANLRAGPDAKFDVVTWAGVGSYASELARKGDWVRVQMQVSKRIGWVYNRSLELVKAGILLPTVTVESDQVAEEPVVGVSSATQKKTADGLLTFKQTSNLHAGPGKQYDIIAWGGKHESAKVIAQQGDWRKVRMTVSGKMGWVFNSLLVKSGVDRVAVAAAAKPAGSIQGGEIYEALRTEPLRADAIQFSELTDWVSKGEAVALLEWRKDWMRVKPQDTEKKAGWIKSEFLKRTGMTSTKVPNDGKLPGVDRVVEYQDRISKGEAFNFSYAALEQALYRIPIEDIHVRIGKDDLKALFRKGTYDKSSFEIRLRTGRRHLQGRIKVLGSSTRIFKKKSLLIKLDKESTRWYGRRKIALRSMASDKALMREWMAWKLLAAMGAKVPEVHFTRVSFNHGEKTGLYLSIEWLGAQFLSANNLDAKGGFYQPNDASHCGDLNSSENMDLCFDKLAPQDDDYSMLSAMAKAVSSASDEDMDKVLAQYFDDESVLNWIVANALVTNGDTYNKNYWLHYSPARKKWTLIPWDYNLTFGRVYDPFATRLNERPFKIFNDNFQYFFPPDVGASNPLKDKTVRNPRLRARLETKLKHLLGLEPNGPEETFGWFSPTVMQARIGNLAAVVGKEVYKDTFLTFGEEVFTKTYESLMHYVTAHDHYLGAKLQGPYIWQPSPAFDPNLPPVAVALPKELYGHGYIDVDGQSLHMTDQGWGYFVARLNLDAPLKKKAEFKVNVEGGMVPKYLPTGQSPRRCVQRSWILSTQTPDLAVDGTLMVEYIQENSARTEVPETLHEELLELWMLDGHHWKPLKTKVNEYANTISAKGVHLESGHILRFVACSPF